LAAACDLAYYVKPEREKVESTIKEWGFPELTIIDKQLGKRIDTQGFVTSNADQILIAFTGSESPPDWLTNLANVIDPGPFPESFVHEGFQDALFPVVLKVCTALQEYNPHQNKSIWITGHSLGGALAVLLAAMLVADETPVQGLYTFGAPRVGDATFAKELDQKMNNLGSYRVENDGDIIPHLPPKFLRFRHSGKAILFGKDGRRIDTENNFLDNLGKDIYAWASHLTVKDFALEDYHKLETPNGYLQRLKEDLER
jgi:triacylglycerol lipase